MEILVCRKSHHPTGVARWTFLSLPSTLWSGGPITTPMDPHDDDDDDRSTSHDQVDPPLHGQVGPWDYPMDLMDPSPPQWTHNYDNDDGDDGTTHIQVDPPCVPTTPWPGGPITITMDPQ